MIEPKTSKEIDRLRVGGKRLAQLLRKLKDFCAIGLPVKDIAKKADEIITDEEAAFFGYQPAGANHPYPDKVCVSVNDAIVHGIPSESDHELASGDLVTIDMGLKQEGLITDAAITFVIGESTDRKDHLLATCQQALDAGIQAAKPGAQVGDISAAIESEVRPDYVIFRQLVGHGVGYSVHEDPTVPNFGTAGTGVELPAGTVVALEPMIGMGSEKVARDDDGYTYRTKDGSLSAHFEHTIAITSDGRDILTQP